MDDDWFMDNDWPVEIFVIADKIKSWRSKCNSRSHTETFWSMLLEGPAIEDYE